MAHSVWATELPEAHTPLARRLEPILASMLASGEAALCDAHHEAAANTARRALFLSHGKTARLTRLGAGRFELAYGDPANEATLGMAIAALAGPGDPIAADPESLSVLALADRLAKSDIPVLIGGPTGTGKEVLSRFNHARSDRAAGPFIAVNCAAMPETMLEAMLFGHRKGAFTGANEANDGFLRAADGGTLLLDEIAEMPLALQAKLLRALQESEVVPIGSTTPVKVDVRVIACANRDLPLEVAEGRFRADLYYRLCVFPLTLAPLAERPADIVPLAIGLALRHTPATGPIPCFTDAALALLKLHPWPGNIRELENVVRRALLLAGNGAAIAAEHIAFDRPARLVAHNAAPQTQPDSRRDTRLSSIVQHSEARAILATLESFGGNRGRAARELGISERTMRYRLASMREAGIEIGRVAAGGAR